jgi:hypothetical protein
MTLLIGTVIGTGNSVLANGNTGTRLLLKDYVASVTGSLETVSYRDNGSDDNLVFVVYSAGGVLLGKTGQVAPASGAVTGTLQTPIAITSGTTYKLGVYCITNYFRYLSDSSIPTKKYDGGSYALPSATLGTVDDDFGIEQPQFWGSGSVVSPTIDSISTPLRHGDTGKTITTSNLGTLTSMTVGGVNVLSLSAPSGDGTFAMPVRADGAVVSSYGASVAVGVGDGTDSAAGLVAVSPPTTEDYVTLTSVNTSVGYLGNLLTLGVGWQVGFSTPGTLGVTNNRIEEDGRIVTDYEDVQTIWVWNVSTKVINSHTFTFTNTPPPPAAGKKKRSIYSAGIGIGL